MRVSFFGHSFISYGVNIKDRIYETVNHLISLGASIFNVGLYGDFDKIALSCCRELKKKNENLKVIVAFNSLNQINKNAELYKDVETCYYETNGVYYKNKIIEMNKQIVDKSDIIVCYVDYNKSRSGAKRAVEYAQKQGKKIINLFKKEDYFLYNLTKEEKKLKLQEFLNSKY